MKMKLLCGDYFTTYSYVNSTESSESSQIAKEEGLCSFHSQQFCVAPLLFRLFLFHAFMMMAADGYYIYTGREVIIPRNVIRVRIDKSLTVIPASAFDGNRNIEELECHDRVKTVEERAFHYCRSLRRVIMPGVEIVERSAFVYCSALADVECGKLERIGYGAFFGCNSLGSIDLLSARIVEGLAFICTALSNVEFGKELESIGRLAFADCTSLERINIPLKDGIITDDDLFRGCRNLQHVRLVEGALHDTIDALLLEEWRNDMKDNLDAINQSLPTTFAGDVLDAGGKAQAVRMWIRSVLRNIDRYKGQHRSYLNEAATTLQHVLPQDIVIKSILPFLELPT
eukprot:scaffold4374_cov84-Skeletonema_dohrnii-CCMP3373.AAC.5